MLLYFILHSTLLEIGLQIGMGYEFQLQDSVHVTGEENGNFIEKRYSSVFILDELRKMNSRHHIGNGNGNDPR